MGKLLTKKTTKDKGTSLTEEKVQITIENNGMYKPISNFSWKDASPAEIHQNSINAYKKYSF